MKSKFFVLLAILTFSLGGTNAIVRADGGDGVPSLIPLPTEKAQWHSIPIKNVVPRLLAWWLDPAHNTEPQALPRSAYLLQDILPSYTAKAHAQTMNAFVLPKGVESVLPVDFQNALLVLSDTEGLQQLQQVVALLDRPLRQVEVDAQIVQISPHDMKEFGIDFGAASSQSGKVQVGFARSNTQAMLSMLLARNRARILMSPRVLAINNLTARLSIFKPQTAVLSFKDATGHTTKIPNETPKNGQAPLSYGTEFSFTVTPTINNDDTVTLLMSPQSTSQLKSAESTLSLGKLTGIETIVNVRDGGTFALTGLDPRLVASLQSADKQDADKTDVVFLVTPCILRRAEEIDNMVPGM